MTDQPVAEPKEHSLTWQDQILAVTEYVPAHASHDVLIMHGASTDQSKVKPLAEALAARDCRVVTFDFTGAGHSSGTISELSLGRRYEEAMAVIADRELRHNLILAGFSMSGQTAVDVAASLSGTVAVLALFVPAIYSWQAHDVCFGPDFSAIIRRPGSWRQSDAVEKIGAFQGTLVTFESPQDQVIPKDVLDLIHASSRQTQHRYRLSLNNTTHKMSSWMCDQPGRAAWCADAILRAAAGTSDFDDGLAQTAGVDYTVL